MAMDRKEMAATFDKYVVSLFSCCLSKEKQQMLSKLIAGEDMQEVMMQAAASSDKRVIQPGPTALTGLPYGSIPDQTKQLGKDAGKIIFSKPTFTLDKDTVSFRAVFPTVLCNIPIGGTQDNPLYPRACLLYTSPSPRDS